MSLEISNETQAVEISPALISRLEQAAGLCLDLTYKNPAGEFSLVIVDDNYIRKLNREYRGKDCTTDVLSFALLETGEEEPPVLGLEDDHLLGDVFISLDTASRQAAEYGHSLEREIVYLAVHGMLHLLGYDHSEESNRAQMREQEEQIMGRLDLRREER